MFIYAHWSSNNHPVMTGFNKEDAAIKYALDYMTKQLNNFAYNYGNEKSKPIPDYYDPQDRPPQMQTKAVDVDMSKKYPEEFVAFKNHMDKFAKERTLDNARIAIELYEDYLKYVVGNESPLHTILDIKVVE